MKREVRLKSGAVPATVVPTKQGFGHTLATVSKLRNGKAAKTGESQETCQQSSLCILLSGIKAREIMAKLYTLFPSISLAHWVPKSYDLLAFLPCGF
jgi:hypothetical protein